MTWNLDATHSSVEFVVKHMMIASTKGRFAEFTVDAEIDEANLANSKATVTINAQSVDTHDEKRDAHLRSGDFFDAENAKNLVFETTKIEPKGSDYKIYGNLTVRGVTKPIVLDAEASGPIKDPWGNTRVGVSATGKVNRKEFGLNWNTVLEAGGFLVGDDVKMNVDIELVKAQ